MATTEIPTLEIIGGAPEMNCNFRYLITTGRHCYGCTAGTGSGCQGAIADHESGK